MALARQSGKQIPQPVQVAASITSASPPASAMAGQPALRQLPHRLQRASTMASGARCGTGWTPGLIGRTRAVERLTGSS